MTEISMKIRSLAVLVAMICLSGCAFDRLQSRANELYGQGKYEDAVALQRAPLIDDPNNGRYRIAYYTIRDKSITSLFNDAEKAQKELRNDEAKAAFLRVLKIDERNARAQDGIRQIEDESRHARMMERARIEFDRGNHAVALEFIRSILVENQDHGAAIVLRDRIGQELDKPRQATDKKLSEAFRTPISIEFRDAQLKQIFEILSRTSGLNFVLDREVKGDQKTTIFLRNSTVAEALSLTLLTNQLEQRVLNSTSVLIYPNTAAKLREYDPLSVKSFVLNYAEAKVVANTLKTILKSKDVVVEEKQNLIIVRDSPDAIRMAEKLVAVHDQPEPEVMLDVEILEVKRSKLQDLGVQFPSQLSLTPLSTGSGSSLRLHDLLNMNSSSIGATINPLTINASSTLSDVNVLANPRIRTRNKEKAKIQVGQKLPNVTSTSTSTGFVAESIQYVDVGLKLEVEPTISAGGEVAIKIGLEVSNVVDKTQTKNGSTAYEIGTRNTTTVLRLRDGQNQVLAGLISNEERSGANRIPGLGDLPLLGRLFGNGRDESLKSEIVLSITPRIVRQAPRLDAGVAEFESGTEANLRTRAMEGGVVSSVPRDNRQGTTGAASEGKISVVASEQGGGAQSARQTEGVNGVSAATAGSGSAPTTAGVGSALTGARLSWGVSGDSSVGGELVVSLNVASDEPLFSVPVSFVYDPSVLALASIEQGDFMARSGVSAVLSQRNDAQSGTAKVLIQSGGSSGGSGNGSLLRLTFNPLKAGGQTGLSVSGGVVATGAGGKLVDLGSVAPYGVVVK